MLRSTVAGAFLMAAVGFTSAGAQVQRPTTSADSLAMAIAIFTPLYTEASRAMGAGIEVICVEGLERNPEPPRGLLDSLQKRDTVTFRAASACRRDPSQTRRIPLHIDTLSGRRGIRLMNTRTAYADDGSFTAYVGYNRGVTWGASWACTGRRTEAGGWIVTGCRSTGAS